MKKKKKTNQFVGSYLFVELQGDTLKLFATETNKEGKTKPTHCIVHRFEKSPPDLEQTLDFLQTTVKGWKLKSARCHVSIPMTNVLIHSPSFPSQDSDEIKGMVDFFIQDKLPYEEHEIASDYRIYKSAQAGFSEISLFAVHKDTLHEALLAPQGVDLPITHVDLSAEGTFSLFMRSPEYKDYGDNETIWLMDIDRDHCDILLVSKKELVYARHIPLGYSHLESDPHAHDHLYREIWQTLKSYDHKVHLEKPKALILSGARRGIQALRDLLVGKLVDLGLSRVHDLDENLLSHTVFNSFSEDYSLTSIIGFGTNRTREKISFIPEEIKLQEELHEKGKELSKCIFLVFCLIFSVGAVFVEKAYENMVIRDRLQERIERIDRESQNLEQLVSETKMAKSLQNPKASIINYIRELHEKTTLNITVEVLTISRERANRITIKGLASSTSDVFKLVEDLQASQEFLNVETKYTTKKKNASKGTEQVQFEVVASLNTSLR